MKKAKYWFDLAYQTAESRKLETLRLRCMEEQIKYDFLDNTSKKAYLEAYLLKKNELKKHAEKVIAYEQNLLLNKEQEKTRKYALYIVIVAIIFLSTIVFYHRTKQNRLKKRFEQIISNIRQEKEARKNNAIFTENESLDGNKNHTVQSDYGLS